MRTTFATARGSKTCATSIIVKVTCDDGSAGIGEVPTSFVVPNETEDSIKRTIRRSKQYLLAQPIAKWGALTEQLRIRNPHFNMTCSGLEMAMFRAYLASTGSNERAWWGQGKARTLTTDITIPFAQDIKTLKLWIEKAVRKGFDTFKIKVSGDVKEDVRFVHSVADILDAADKSYTIRLDGNQGFTCESALRLLDRLKVDVELFEQPLKHNDYNGMKKLTAKAPIPIIADEMVFSVDDCQRVIENNLAHGINIKIAKSGITQSRQMITLAKKADLTLMIGCMTETMTGLSAAIHCAMGTGAFDYIDMDSIHFLHHRKQYDTISIDGPAYHTGEQP